MIAERKKKRYKHICLALAACRTRTAKKWTYVSGGVSSGFLAGRAGGLFLHGGGWRRRLGTEGGFVRRAASTVAGEVLVAWRRLFRGGPAVLREGSVSFSRYYRRRRGF